MRERAMIRVGSIVARPGGHRQWLVKRRYQELMSHREMVQIVPVGPAWNMEPLSLPIEMVREVPLEPPDLEDFPAA